MPEKARQIVAGCLQGGSSVKKKEFSCRYGEPFWSEEKGITFLEVLIALAIIGLMVPAVVNLLVAASGYMLAGGEETVAVELAGARMEELKSLSYTCMEERGYTTEGGFTEDYGSIAGYRDYKRVTAVTAGEILLEGGSNPAPVYRFEVRVYWNGAEDPRQERFLRHQHLAGTGGGGWQVKR